MRVLRPAFAGAALAQAGMDVNDEGLDGRTPAWEAAYSGKQEALKFLLEVREGRGAGYSGLRRTFSSYQGC